MTRPRRNIPGSTLTTIATFIALTSAGLSTPGYAAESNAQVAERWGLVGTWRTDCSRPTSRRYPRYIYAVRDGALYHDRRFGNKLRDSHKVDLATIKPDGSIELLVTFTIVDPPQTRLYSFVKGPDGRIRTWSNRDVNKTDYVIRNGKFVGSGKPPSWLSRCS